MSPTLPEAAPGYRWELQVPEPARRRSPWRWLIGILVLVVLAVGAWLAGEWLARDIVTKTVRSAVVTQLGAPEDQEVDVVLQGSVLLQVILGRLDDVTVSSDDIAVGPITGDIAVHATGVSLRGEHDASAASATIALDEAQLRALMATVEGFPADTLALKSPDVTMTYTLQVLAAQVPVGVSLTPTAVDGDLVLRPASFQVGDAELSVDDVRDRFGALAKLVLGDWTVCIAQYIPVGMTLSGTAVAGGELIADFAVSGDIVADPTLQEKGTCD
ncbi:MAG: DUF2993 domain-containing protein [Microbacterium sp.]